MRNDTGFSLIELLVVVSIILIIAAIAIPNLLRARMAANESAAAANIKNVRDAQATYIATYGASIGFASSLAQLGPGAPCGPLNACLLDSVLGCAADPCRRSNYLFYMVSVSAAPVIDFTVTATPVGWGSTGQRNFCVFEDGVIRQQINPVASLPGPVARADCANATEFKEL